MVLNRCKFQIVLWFKNFLKYNHGYSKYCMGKRARKCVVCSTPWPEKQKTPTERYLESVGYYDKYIKIYFPPNDGDGLTEVGGIFRGGYLDLPEGISGEEILKIARDLKYEYNLITKGTGEEEIKRRGALEGHEEKDFIPKL